VLESRRVSARLLEAVDSGDSANSWIDRVKRLSASSPRDDRSPCSIDRMRFREAVDQNSKVVLQLQAHVTQQCVCQRVLRVIGGGCQLVAAPRPAERKVGCGDRAPGLEGVEHDSQLTARAIAVCRVDDHERPSGTGSVLSLAA